MTQPPEDLDERTVVFLDCGNLDRNPLAGCARRPLINIDHHHDNTRFGTVNHVVADASCTAEIVWDLMLSLGVELTPDRRGALRRPRHRHRPLPLREHAAAGTPDGRRADRGGRRRRRVYRRSTRASVRQARAARACAGALVRYADGRFTVAVLTPRTSPPPAPRTATPRASSTTCARWEAPRSRRSIRDVMQRRAHSGERKVSLRATDDDVDVSAIARAYGGGGHRRAAGFTTDLERALEFLAELIRRDRRAQVPSERERRFPSRGGSCWSTSPWAHLA